MAFTHTHTCLLCLMCDYYLQAPHGTVTVCYFLTSLPTCPVFSVSHAISTYHHPGLPSGLCAAACHPIIMCSSYSHTTRLAAFRLKLSQTFLPILTFSCLRAWHTTAPIQYSPDDTPGWYSKAGMRQAGWVLPAVLHLVLFWTLKLAGMAGMKPPQIYSPSFGCEYQCV